MSSNANPDPASIWAQVAAQDAARTRLAAQALPANKTALFDALAVAGITSVVVTFDGYGDAGQIEHLAAYAGDQPATLPALAATIATPRWDGSACDQQTLPLHEAIAALAYDFLSQTHAGWENNAGAFGEFTFDVTQRAIQLDYNERIEAAEHHGHAW